jgi:hypothetical protein
MPSTFSPNLRIELIATGEQSGTWGTTTNTNLGSLIEDAISGYVSVSVVSDNQALTASNGQPDQSRNMMVDLTTTTTADFNVYIPPVEKFYVFRNSSAYSATVYCSTVLGNTTAAGTGVTIPANNTTIIFSTGVNVVSSTNYLPTLSLGTDLAVTHGGTGVSSTTAYGVLTGGTTSTGAFQNAGTGVLGDVLTSGGPSALPTWQAVLTIIPAGTLMLFQQTSAPTGWTKQTLHNNKALRVVSGTASSGGSVDFTTAFASQAVSGTVGNTTLTTAQIPAHSHSFTTFGGASGIGTFNSGSSPVGTASTANEGGGGSHNHSFTGNPINLAVSYVDLIIASKN